MRWLLCLLAALAGSTLANDFATLYAPAQLDRTRERTVPGVLANFRDVVWPALTAAEREQLGQVDLSFPALGPNGPLDFYATAPPATINLPLTSLRFYADICLAAASLNRTGQSPQPVYDYLAMLKHRPAADFADDRYPAPLAALGIPESARDDPRLDQIFYHCYASTVVFILGHELAHLYYQDPGYAPGVPRAVAKRNETRADAFALELMRRLAAPPIGTPVFFMALAHLEANRYDFRTEAEFQAALAEATHPLTSARLRAIAGALRERAADFARADADPGATRDSLSQVGSEIERIAALLDDPDIQQGIGLTAQSTDPAVFVQRHSPPVTGAHGTLQRFSGRYRGKILDAQGVAMSVEVVLERLGNQVSGHYAFGMGDGVISDGVIRDEVLYYNWRWGS
uniref:hypothetical protein n=1 Tax=Immundisolibacter sp. TaxID=1934948 RepID=UPI00356451DF